MQLLSVASSVIKPVSQIIQRRQELKQSRHVAKIELEKERIVARQGSKMAGLVIFIVIYPMILVSVGYTLGMFNLLNNFTQTAMDLVYAMDELLGGHYYAILVGVVTSIFGIQGVQTHKVGKRMDAQRNLNGAASNGQSANVAGNGQSASVEPNRKVLSEADWNRKEFQHVDHMR